MVREHVDAVVASCHRVWSPEQFLAHNKVRWGQIHEQLRARNGAQFAEDMPYLLDAAMDVVRQEQPGLFSSAPQLAAQPVVAAARPGSKLGHELAALPRSQHQALAEAQVCQVVASLGGASTEVSASTPLMEAGIDSLAATELSRQLQELTAMPLSPTLMFECPTPRAIAEHILEQLGGVEPGRPSHMQRRRGRNGAHMGSVH